MYAREFAANYHEDHHNYYQQYNCDASSSLQMSDNGDCWRLIKNANVVTPLPEFEVAFVHALDHIGVRTKLKDPLAYDLSNITDTSVRRRRLLRA